MSSPRIAITIDLKELYALQREYLNEVGGDLAQQLTLSLFLQWLVKQDRQRKDATANGPQESIATNPGNQPIQQPQ